nr:hypothetical protein [Tanacetum cinerariifolium]
EEFVQSIQSFFTDKKRLTMPLQGKKKTTPLLILNIRFTKLIIHHLKTKHNIHPRTDSLLHYSHKDNVLSNLRSIKKDGREVFGMPIPDAFLTNAIKRAPYYGGYLAHVAEYQQYLDGEHGMTEEEAVPKSSAPNVTKVTEPKEAIQTKPSVPKATKVIKPAGHVAKKRKSKSPLKLVDKFVDEESDVPDISMAEDTEMEVTHTETPVTTTDNLKLPVEEHVNLEEPASSTGTLCSLHHLDKGFNFGDQFLNDKSSDVEKDKTHAEVEVESMVTVTIQQDTSSIPLMTFKVVDLPRTIPDDPNVHSPLSSTSLVVTLITTTFPTITTATTTPTVEN